MVRFTRPIASGHEKGIRGATIAENKGRRQRIFTLIHHEVPHSDGVAVKVNITMKYKVKKSELWRPLLPGLFSYHTITQ